MCLGVLTIAAAPAARAQSSDTQKLQDENATLRQQVADLEAVSIRRRLPPPHHDHHHDWNDGRPAAAATGGEGITVLSPYEVSTGRDQGYLASTSITGTRTSQSIQETPMYLQVMSSEFLADTNSVNLTDIFKYVPGASGDNRFVSDRPTNSSTPSSVPPFAASP